MEAVTFQTGKETEDPNSIQKAADFVTAFVYGFDVEDSLALIRLDDLYLETFDVKDGKNLCLTPSLLFAPSFINN